MASFAPASACHHGTCCPGGKIVLVGASGCVGKATVSALVRRAGPSNVVVATRNPADPTAAWFKEQGLCVMRGGLNDPASLLPLFEGASAVYLIAPSTADRAELVLNGINAARTAGVSNLLVLSVATADDLSTVFGKQFNLIEQEAKRCGVSYTILRLPFFMDNATALHGPQVKASGKFSSCLNPSTRYSAVAVQDAGEAAALILLNPSTHAGKTYTLSAPLMSKTEMAAALSKTMGRPVEFQQISYDAEEKYLLGLGWPAWQVSGIMEMFRAMNEGKYVFPDTDLRKLLDREPANIQAWVTANKAAFM